MSDKDVARIKSLLYLYFDAAEAKHRERFNSIRDRILMNGRNISYEDAVKILEVKHKLDIIDLMYHEICSLLDEF